MSFILEGLPNSFTGPKSDDILLKDEKTPETVLMNTEIKFKISQILDGLSAIQKHLLILKYEQDLSYKEVE